MATIKDLKKLLLKNYNNKGLNNCLGSAKNVISELFADIDDNIEISNLPQPIQQKMKTINKRKS